MAAAVGEQWEGKSDVLLEDYQEATPNPQEESGLSDLQLMFAVRRRRPNPSCKCNSILHANFPSSPEIELGRVNVSNYRRLRQ